MSNENTTNPTQTEETPPILVLVTPNNGDGCPLLVAVRTGDEWVARETAYRWVVLGTTNEKDDPTPLDGLEVAACTRIPHHSGTITPS